MGDVHISLTTMDVPIMMMWESNANEVHKVFQQECANQPTNH